MVIAGLVFSALAALVHVYIFYMESIIWTSKRARTVFGTTEEEAQITKPLAFNQGFYNLFLGIAVVVGIVFYATGDTAVGATLMFVGAGSMLAAALVLAISSPDKARAAAVQGLFPLLAVVALIIGLVLA